MNNAALKGIRELADSTARYYPVVLTFTREFTDGTFEGHTHEDVMGFCTQADADEWIASVNRANSQEKIDYRIIKWSFR